jgi:hypothetical protein
MMFIEVVHSDQLLYMSKFIEDAVFRDTFTSLFCFTLLLSISFATNEWTITEAFATRLSTEPAFSLKILNYEWFTAPCRPW